MRDWCNNYQYVQKSLNQEIIRVTRVEMQCIMNRFLRYISYDIYLRFSVITYIHQIRKREVSHCSNTIFVWNLESLRKRMGTPL